MKSTSRAGPPSATPERAPSSTFFAGLEQRFEAAWDPLVGRRRAVAIGGLTVTLRFSGPELESLLMRCLAHIEVDVPERGDASIDCLAAPAGELPWQDEAVAGDGEARTLVGGRAWMTHDPRSGRLEAVDPTRRRAVAFYPDPTALAPHELATPLRASLLRLLDRPGLRFLHAGAVAGTRGAALLVGSSGSGKSTLALACLRSGLGYLGDDYVALAAGEAASTVCSVHASAKLDPASLELLGDLAASMLAGTPNPKLGLCLLPRSAQRLTRSAPLAEIIVPRIGAESTRLRPLPPARALLAMAPSTMIQHPGRDRGALAEMRELVIATRCWDLAIDADPATAAAAVGELLG